MTLDEIIADPRTAEILLAESAKLTARANAALDAVAQAERNAAARALRDWADELDAAARKLPLEAASHDAELSEFSLRMRIAREARARAAAVEKMALAEDDSALPSPPKAASMRPP